jgi:hypothetical protein
MGHQFIELHRRFEEFQTGESRENLARRSYAASLSGGERGISWDELLQNRLVVILGEPGSGKTQELKARHRFMRSTRSFSFFLRLEQLVNEEVKFILNEDECRELEKWQAGDGDATFFLDAVDESKIRRHDDFMIALERVKKAMGSSLKRSRFVVSSRISEWRPQADQQIVLQCLGVAQASVGFTGFDDQTVLDKSSAVKSLGDSLQKPDGKMPAKALIVVTLLPLVPSQISFFARARGVCDPQEFISALAENNAWAFAGRPLDVSHLYTYWTAKGHLGNLTELTEYMIERLLAEVPNKEKQDPLTPQQARHGAECLAAAVIFCRNLRIRVSDDTNVGDDLISPVSVLPVSWHPVECHAMTDRALFDAASHGSISFHHRYHTEYLAAAWIEGLMARTCGLDALEDMLFAFVDGQRVLRPALAPVAAWLVTAKSEPWRLRLAEWILASAPEIHLMHGDPAALPLDYRRRILSSLIDRFKGRTLVRLNRDYAALARLADKGLVNELNCYLLDSDISTDLRSDLLMVVRAGKLLECVPAALALFADPGITDDFRSYAAMVVRDIGTIEHRRQMALSGSVLPRLSNAVLELLCGALFPKVIGVDGLLSLLRRSNEVGAYDRDLRYGLKKLLEDELVAAQAGAFLQGMLAMLVVPPLLDSLALSKHFLWMVILIPICLRKMLSESNPGEEIFDLAIAAIFVLEQVTRDGDVNLMINEKKELQFVREAIDAHQELRRRLFWARVADFRLKTARDPDIYDLNGYGTLLSLTGADLAWLLNDAGQLPLLPDRCFAMSMAANLLCSRQWLLPSAWQLLRRSSGNRELVAICQQYVVNRLRAPVMNLWFNYFRHRLLEKWWWNQRSRKLKQYFAVIRDRWWLWRHLGGLRKGLYLNTLMHFASMAKGRDHNQYSGDDWGEAAKKWGWTITLAAKQGCMADWRRFSPPLPHERAVQNSVSSRVVVGLVGLETSWREGLLDFAGFSANDVGLAIRYACNELNGMPDWFAALLAARPLESSQILNIAISGEWDLPPELEFVHDVMAKLAGMANSVETITQLCLAQLQRGDPLHPTILRYGLSVILQSNSRAIAELAPLAAIRVNLYADKQEQWLTWMNTWFQLEALPALDYLENMLSAKSDVESDLLIIRLCATLSGRNWVRQQVGEPSFLTPPALARLIPLVNRHVRKEEDIERANQGVYSPDERDYSQEFRSRLWAALRAWPGSDADVVLRTLFINAVGEDRDWILHLLDGRKSLRADDVAWMVPDIRIFGERYRSEPHSDYQLFRLVVRFLQDIRNHVELSENAANRLQVRKDDLEKDFRGFLAKILIEKSLSWFSVTQESEVDLAQRPDLRIERPGLNPVPVEIKLANLNWTMHRLMERLEIQLVGQYLRPAHIRHGVYVLGNTDPKRYWEIPGSSEKLNFSELVKRIQQRAIELQSELRAGVDGIEVIGIDFSDPRKR